MTDAAVETTSTGLHIVWCSVCRWESKTAHTDPAIAHLEAGAHGCLPPPSERIGDYRIIYDANGDPQDFRYEPLELMTRKNQR